MISVLRGMTIKVVSYVCNVCILLYWVGIIWKFFSIYEMTDAFFYVGGTWLAELLTRISYLSLK